MLSRHAACCVFLTQCLSAAYVILWGGRRDFRGCCLSRRMRLTLQAHVLVGILHEAWH